MSRTVDLVARGWYEYCLDIMFVQARLRDDDCYAKVMTAAY